MAAAELPDPDGVDVPELPRRSQLSLRYAQLAALQADHDTPY
jgi:hypothetical protein